MTAPAGQVACPDSLGRSLLESAARAAHRQGATGLGRVPMLGRRPGVPQSLRAGALAYDARCEAIAPDAVAGIDPEAVAEWVVGHYPSPTYPAVVVGSAHGAAVHAAALMGAPWLPAGFSVTVAWPGGRIGDWASAMRHGGAVAVELLAARPGISVRQVHDPISRGPLCGSTITLQIRWRRLPAAYRRFLRKRVRPGGGCLLVRDVRPWPILRLGAGVTFQVGTPANGWSHERYTLDTPAFGRLLRAAGEERWQPPRWGLPMGYTDAAVEPEFEPDLHAVAVDAGQPSSTVLYHDAQALSAGVADLWRAWMLDHGRGNDCLISCDRLIDPWSSLSAGFVPYWCESASRAAVGAAEWWLAGSRPFDTVTALPQPPGTACDAHAGLREWRSLTTFATGRGHIDPRAVSRYPMLPLPSGHAAAALTRQTGPGLSPDPVPLAEVVAALRRAAPAVGLFVV